MSGAAYSCRTGCTLISAALGVDQEPCADTAQRRHNVIMVVTRTHMAAQQDRYNHCTYSCADRLHSDLCSSTDESGALAQKLLHHHLVLTRDHVPAQQSAREIPSATTESNHHSEAFMLYMSVDTTMAADSTATAPDVIASFLRLSERSFLCSNHRAKSVLIWAAALPSFLCHIHPVYQRGHRNSSRQHSHCSRCYGIFPRLSDRSFLCSNQCPRSVQIDSAPQMCLC